MHGADRRHAQLSPIVLTLLPFSVWVLVFAEGSVRRALHLYLVLIPTRDGKSGRKLDSRAGGDD